MALIGLVSAKGSPGVSTLAMELVRRARLSSEIDEEQALALALDEVQKTRRSR